MERYNFYSRILATGAPAPGSTVTVYTPPGTLNIASIFSDDGITPLANPFTTDSNGFGFFYAADGDYDVRNSGTGITSPYTWGDITLGPNTSGNHTWTGVNTFNPPIAVGSGGTGMDASAVTNGQLLIGHDANNNFSLAALTGTANQVVVTNGAGSITLSLPQSIAAASSPTFTNLTLSGGAVVGFAGAVLADAVQVGDANFGIDFNTGNPQVFFDSGDWLRYTRATNSFSWAIAATDEMLLDASGVQIVNGLIVGFTGVPANDVIGIGDANFNLNFNTGTAPFIAFDSGNDVIQFTRATNTYSVLIGGVTEALITAAGLQVVDGLVVGFSGTPSADQVQVGDANFALDLNAGSPQLVFDTGTDALRYDRTSNFWQFLIGGVEEVRVEATGIRITDGLVVGFASSPGPDSIQVGDSAFIIDYAGGFSPGITFASGDTIQYVRASDVWSFLIGSTTVMQIGATPFLSLGASPAVTGTVRLANNANIVWRNAAGSADLEGVQINASNILELGSGATDIQWGRALITLGGGAAPTLGTIGGSGPAVAAQNTWLRVMDSTGVAAFIPVWK